LSCVLSRGWAGKFAREKTPDRAHRGVKGSISTTGTKDTTKNEAKEERAYEEEERALSRLKQLSAMPRSFCRSERAKAADGEMREPLEPFAYSIDLRSAAIGLLSLARRVSRESSLVD